MCSRNLSRGRLKACTDDRWHLACSHKSATAVIVEGLHEAAQYHKLRRHHSHDRHGTDSKLILQAWADVLHSLLSFRVCKKDKKVSHLKTTSFFFLA